MIIELRDEPRIYKIMGWEAIEGLDTSLSINSGLFSWKDGSVRHPPVWNIYDSAEVYTQIRDLLQFLKEHYPEALL